MLPHMLPPIDERLSILRFAATFLWADHRVAHEERRFFFELAKELGFDDLAVARNLLEAPPLPEDVNPSNVPPNLARVVRNVALRAIASDGAIEESEMEMFFLLDELLPPDEAFRVPKDCAA